MPDPGENARKRPLKKLTKEMLEPVWSRKSIPVQKIADQFGCTPQAIISKAKNFGLPPRTKCKEHLKNGTDEEFAKMWNANVSTKDMATHFGYSCGASVSNRAKRMGLPIRTRGKSGKRNGGWKGNCSLDTIHYADLAAAMKEAAIKEGQHDRYDTRKRRPVRRG